MVAEKADKMAVATVVTKGVLLAALTGALMVDWRVSKSAVRWAA